MTSAVPPEELALCDLFVPAPLNAAAPRVLVHLDMSAAQARRAEEAVVAAGWLPDTPWCAAWLLLQNAWRGLNRCGLRQRRDSGACDEPLQVGLCEIGLASTSQSWLREVDRQRRSWLEGPRERSEASTSADEFVWLVEAETRASEPGPAGAGPMLWLSGQDRRRLVLDAPSALLDESQARVLLAAIVQAGSALLTRPQATLGEIDTLGEAQRLRLLSQWNPPLRSTDSSATVHGLYARRAAEHRQATALACNGEQMSYAELDRRSTRMARRLQAAGVMPGSTVGVALERSLSSVVVLLATLKAGAAYLPVDCNHPPQRLAFMLADAAAVLVVTTASRRQTFDAVLRVLLADDAPDDSTADQRLEPVAANAESLAYVMYTSGSTGTPKGIEITHRAILRLVVEARYVELTPGTRVMHAAPLGFDASTLEIWGPLLNGACCVLHDEHLPTPAGLARTIRGEGVTTAWLTSALFNAVVDDDVRHLHGLRQLLIGGEALSVAHVRRALQALPEVTLINGYGPTECTTFATTYRIPRELPPHSRTIPIGRPITDTTAYVLGPTQQPLPIGLVGELYVGGHGLARGYLNRPELTTERFVAHPFGAPGERLYRTGDRVRYLPDGNLEFIGRADGQVKVRGFRIELGEIEAAMMGHASVQACAVVAGADSAGNARLVAYAAAAPGQAEAPTYELRGHLAQCLPEFMIPAAFVWIAALPITPNGKLDRHALPEPPSTRPGLAQPYQQPVGDGERRVCLAFVRALGVEPIGRHDNFFDLGGNSLLVLRVLADLERNGSTRLSTTTFLEQATPAALALALAGDTPVPQIDSARLPRSRAEAHPELQPIAIIAMAGRFPGARSIEQFWDNLCAGQEGITFFQPDELDPGLPAALTADPSYVRARGVIDDVEWFDAAFFGISPREAELMDPQQRVFLELCWECLERGGHAPDATLGPVGVFAGMYNATYFQRHVAHRPDLIDKLGEFQVMLANEKDYIATRVAHRLNLTGPAVNVQTACSTSLVAIAQAFASLRAGQCDMALAGGASITCPPRSGYLYQDGAMLSPDGHTRSFDTGAQGTVFSDGAAVVLLKRLDDAVADGNTVLALIRGVAINNDGRHKASFTAPSVDGQAAVIVAAQAAAGVDASSISYVETHGTATPLGDPVELEGLTRAFRRSTADIGFCRIGSLKSNVGHLVIAAGAAGVIKTALALAEEKLPPSIHFDRPNPKIDFAGSPFVVNHRLMDWPRGSAVRRAGVSSFGVGGTNAHVVMEEAALPAPSSTPRGAQLLQLSARTPDALGRMAVQLADWLEAMPTANLADVAHTLQVGRSRFEHRLCVVAETTRQAAAALRQPDHPWRGTRSVGASATSLVWLFPGQGSQYAGMGGGLHAADPAFRQAFDECQAAMQPWLGFDLRAHMSNAQGADLAATEAAQPATFCLEYALAHTWLARGARPAALIGHSLGEFVAAVLAGVMSLADAARLVARRGVLMQALPGGSMLAVRLPASKVLDQLPLGLSLAAENAAAACVISGPSALVQSWQAQLAAAGVIARRLQTSHAFHSSMMDAALQPFEAEVRRVMLAPPRIPIVSTLSGTWMTEQDATDPRYWVRHLQEPVRFAAALHAVLKDADAVFLEIGPRAFLAALARQQAIPAQRAAVAVSSLGDAPQHEAAQMMLAQGQLWALGLELPAPAALPLQGRRRLVLPTYPFERQRFWIDAPITCGAAAPLTAAQPASIRGDDTETPSHLSPASSSPSADRTPSGPAAADTQPVVSRRAALLRRLRVLLEDVAGVDLEAADASVPFVELGLDSLTLTQAALQVKKQFGVAITFRQLMESYRSLDSLAEFLDGALPAEPVEKAVSTATGGQPAMLSSALAMPGQSLPAGTVEGSGAALLRQLIEQQMQLLAQQLALLSAATGATTPANGQAGPAAAHPTALAPRRVDAATAAKTPAPAEAAVRYDVKKAFGAIARIHTQASPVTKRQRTRLEAFMRRYVERTRKSRDCTVRHRPHLADPRVVNGFRPLTKEITYQIVVERSKGSRLWDIDGNEYIDVLNGFGMNLFGWQPDFVQDAVRAQIDAGYEIGPQHPLAGEVAERVCQLTGFDRAGLCNTGSEAVMAAVRIARTVTGRSTVVLFTGSYHGTFDEVLVRAGRGGKGTPAAPGIMPGMFGDVHVLDYGTPEALAFIGSHADDLAAVLVEPVQSRRPDFQPREFLHQVRAITQRSATCLIFDEVITGFRSHLGGTQALFGLRADLACYGKVIGGGFPIGVVAGRRDYMDALDGGSWQFGDDSIPSVGVTYFAGTFVRHPLALAAAKASLEHLRQRGPDLQVRLNTMTAAMVEELNAYCRQVGAPIELRHFSSLWRVSWFEDHPLQDLLFAMMRSRGVHILDNFPCFFTTAHSEADIRHVVVAFKESVRELQESDFLPGQPSPALEFDASRPPLPGARLGKDADGNPAWFVRSPENSQQYMKVSV